MNNYIYGRRSVLEYLRSGREAEKLYLQKGEAHGSIQQIERLAREKKIVIVQTDQQKLSQMTDSKNHQGVVLLAEDFDYSTVEEILGQAREKGHDPFVLILDELTDPHNVGAIIRTAECAGIDGIIIPRRRSSLITEAVERTSSGATTYMKIAKVNNINMTIDQLKKENLWVYGAAGEASQSFWETDFSGGVCLVIGSEGEGIAALTKEKCDLLVSIPMFGHIESLNASVSAAVLMYEVVRQRTRGR